jgi:glyoxylase-like metal-dependent hydrolase (beta-lactamase superfamily II)
VAAPLDLLSGLNVLSIVRVLAPNPSVYTLEGTNTWIVGDGPTIVIDPGPDLPEHLDEVAGAAGHVSAVLVTHDHPDHAPGAAAFAERVGAPLHALRMDGARRLKDRQVFRAGPLEVVAVSTPGHTPDHVAFWIEEPAALFTGDAVLGRGTSFLDPPEGDLAQYLRSLKKMLDLGPRTIYPGHGPVVLQAREKLREYLDHRAQREEQVLGALADGPATIPEIVETIYAGYPQDVHALAGRSVLAHLLKLESQGHVQHEGTADTARYEIHEPQTCERCGRRKAQPRSKYCGSCSLAMLQGD